MRALVLAAGKGVRLWPLTEHLPKPLLPIANKSLLETTIESLVFSGIKKIVVLVGFNQEKIRQKLGNGKRLGCSIEYVTQKRLGGTADAVLASYEKLRQETRFLAVYSDDYYDRHAVKRFVIANNRENRGMSMAVSSLQDAAQFGSVQTKRGHVSGINEKTGNHAKGLVNIGLYVLEESIFDAIRKTGKSKRGEYELTDSLNLLVEKGERINAFPFRKNEWVGISYPWDLLEANRLVVACERKRQDGNVGRNVSTEGSVVVESGTLIKSGTYIEGPVHIGRDCVIGPNSYLRPFSSIGNRVKIGAGCEVKNSIIMDDVKIPHLSYVGDSIIGTGSELGAGTITANLRFDLRTVKSKIGNSWIDSQKIKLGTVIGDNVKTGINVSIFPGVRIGSESWIGPGAVLKQDVPKMSRIGS
jgi:bifunctional UDP-N-acetylglucosamine pyrophosphorylase/glucosamine-1-phosphate N-acetyltransferase